MNIADYTDVTPEIAAYVSIPIHRRLREWITEQHPDRPLRLARLAELARGGPPPVLTPEERQVARRAAKPRVPLGQRQRVKR